eukprot:CAMPEP_0198209050 /NCGR_PEP_ID=MMETSP1445-20131203/12373_1 /TAXON_ID=36898 /ORGANISM="Pyramimonas sp., Strain CCMP2087" /LENGTH=461 /DNA_ID=CAMNT_0043882679 /DNA_START=290 /DNA_END=1675 /DNA_ORIENTATION=+
MQLGYELSALIQCKTLSSPVAENHMPPESVPEFKKAHDLLRRFYPFFYKRAHVETINEFSKLMRIDGADPNKKPLMLLCHMDVVPVEAGTESGWKHPPFAGKVSEGYIWGRGALDNKQSCVGILHAIEILLTRPKGFVFQRTIYVAIGHDEEVGGALGAVATVERLKERGIELEAVLDEGMMIVKPGSFPFINRHIALVGTAEKGFMSIQISTNISGGGHSSRPPLIGTPVTHVSAAVSKIQNNQFPPHIGPPMTDFFDSLSKELVTTQPFRFLVERWRAFEWVIKMVLVANERTNILIRTTSAATLFNAGVKENMIPSVATATFNHRLIPGASNLTVLKHYQNVLGEDAIVTFNPTTSMPNGWTPPSPVAPIDNDAFKILKGAIKFTFGSSLPVLPFLVPAGADARHYVSVAGGRVYRFYPMLMGDAEMSLLHATNERIALADLANACTFYQTFVERMCQ